MIQPFTDEYFMKKALQEAEIAFEKGEIPVGAHSAVCGKFWRAGGDQLLRYP